MLQKVNHACAEEESDLHMVQGAAEVGLKQ